MKAFRTFVLRYFLDARSDPNFCRAVEERYLGVRQDLADAPCDHLGITVDVPR
jgi:hypothetical protein